MAKVFRQFCLFAFAVATPLAGQRQNPDLYQQVLERNLYMGATTGGTLLAEDAKLEKLASGYKRWKGRSMMGRAIFSSLTYPTSESGNST